MITQDYLLKWFHLDKATGVLYWRKYGRHKLNFAAGNSRKDGYVQIKIKGRLYLAHRLVWLFVHGAWPTEEIDHINGRRSDNRPKNLRQATRLQNAANYKKPSHNTSGVKGIAYHKSSGKWQAYIGSNKKQISLGSFDTIEAAQEVRIRATRKYHAEFARI